MLMMRSLCASSRNKRKLETSLAQAGKAKFGQVSRRLSNLRELQKVEPKRRAKVRIVGLMYVSSLYLQSFRHAYSNILESAALPSHPLRIYKNRRSQSQIARTF